MVDTAQRLERKPRRRPGLPRLGRRVATAALLVALGVALLAAVPELRGVLREIRHIAPGWIAVAVALELASDVSFVLVFRLFFERLEARDARLLAWTEQGSGALIPGGGAGGLAIGGWLMSLTGVPVGWIARRSGGLFFLGAATSGAALIGAGVALIAGAPGPHALLTVVLPTALAALATILIAALPALMRHWPRAPRWLAAIASAVGEAQRTTFQGRPRWRLVGALGYLGFDIAVLWVILRAIGPAPSIAAVTLAYSVGYAANSLPVPGGIGVLDAGLTGALVLYGVSPVHAAAAAIVYHAIAFWVPGLGGMVAYLRLRPQLLRAEADAPDPRAEAVAPDPRAEAVAPDPRAEAVAPDPRAEAVVPDPAPDTPSSEEAHHARTHAAAQTNSSRLGRRARRRSRARPLSRSVR